VKTVYHYGIADEQLPWHGDAGRAAAADGFLRALIRQMISEGHTSFCTSLQTPSDKLFETNVQRYRSICPDCTVTLVPAHNEQQINRADIIVMPLENPPRSRQSVAAAILARDLGKELIFYSNAAIHRAVRCKIEDITPSQTNPSD